MYVCSVAFLLLLMLRYSPIVCAVIIPYLQYHGGVVSILLLSRIWYVLCCVFLASTLEER